MKIRSFFAIVICLGTVAAASAQTPAPHPPAETRAFSMFWEGEGSYLGVQTQEITRENLGKYGLREVRGVGVEKVVEGTPAAAAGLQNGDVIVKFNGEEVTGARKLSRLIGEVAPDHRVTLVVLRGGSERELTATVGKRPMPQFSEGGLPGFSRAPGVTGRIPMPAIPAIPGTPPVAPDGRFRMEEFGDGQVFGSFNGRQIGMGVWSLSKQLAAHYGVDAGVLVNNVREGSPAAKAGLRAGDIIVEASGTAVRSEADLRRAIMSKKEGDLSLTFVRAGSRQTVSVTPEEMPGAGFDGPVLIPGALGPGTRVLVRPNLY